MPNIKNQTEAFCKKPDCMILKAIKEKSIPDKILIDKTAWKKICEVRGRYINEITPRTWKLIC